MPQDNMRCLTTYGTGELPLPRHDDSSDTPDQGRSVGPTTLRFSSLQAKKASFATVATAALVAFALAFLGSIGRIGLWEASDEGAERSRQAGITPFAFLHLHTASTPLETDRGDRHEIDDREDRYRSILLLRHAKSSWDNPANTTDEERPLAPEGEGAAKRLGVFLRTNEVELPDLIVSSPSVRTRSTLSLVLERWLPDAAARDTIPIRYNARLYESAFSGSGYHEYVLRLDPAHRRVMLVGHNPAIRSLARRLVPPDYDHRFISKRTAWRKFPPGAFAEIRGEGSWNTWEGAEGELVMFVPAKATRRLLFGAA